MKREQLIDLSAPSTVRWAAAAFFAYGLVVVASATAYQTMSDWEGVDSYPRALIRGAGVTVVAWGLLQRARWARWLAIGLSVFWLAYNAFAAALLVWMPEAVTTLPAGFFPIAGITTALLIAVLVLLLMSSSRAAFRRGAAR